MSRLYQEIEGLARVVLEESYVLDIEAHPAILEFRIDFVLSPEHPDYRQPHPDETYSTHRGWLRFSGVSSCVWSDQGAPPARDATGEIDFGNIDSLEWDNASYRLEGDWGRMEIAAEQVIIQLD
jgi:hypothetical protein